MSERGSGLLFSVNSSTGFADWWALYRDACKLHKRSPGPKKKALVVWQRKKYAEQCQEMLRRLVIQMDAHREFLKAKQFIPAFPDAHRYLRDERWRERPPELT